MQIFIAFVKIKNLLNKAFQEVYWEEESHQGKVTSMETDHKPGGTIR